MLGWIVAVNDNGEVKTDSQRGLRLAILDQIARTGKILLRARRDIPDRFDALLRQFNITPEEACDLIAVYHSIDVIKEAEQWEHDQGYDRVPHSAREALELLARWRKTRH